MSQPSPSRLRQRIRFVTATDGARLAWAEAGEGPVLVKAANYSKNHVLLEHEAAWTRFREAVLAFVQPGATAGESVFAALSARERQVLALIGDGLSNTDIAERLQISEKTVRNHASNLFDKLGVWSRAQALVFARDHGFGG